MTVCSIGALYSQIHSNRVVLVVDLLPWMIIFYLGFGLIWFTFPVASPLLARMFGDSSRDGTAESRKVLDSLVSLRAENQGLRQRLQASNDGVPKDVTENRLDLSAEAAASRVHLTTSFEAYGRRNDRAANVLLLLAIIVLTTSFGFAFYLLHGLPDA